MDIDTVRFLSNLLKKGDIATALRICEAEIDENDENDENDKVSEDHDDKKQDGEPQ